MSTSSVTGAGPADARRAKRGPVDPRHVPQAGHPVHARLLRPPVQRPVRGGPLNSMTWANLVGDAEALREHLGFESWSILGHSFGGHVAIEYVLRHPERVSR